MQWRIPTHPTSAQTQTNPTNQTDYNLMVSITFRSISYTNKHNSNTTLVIFFTLQISIAIIHH